MPGTRQRMPGMATGSQAPAGDDGGIAHGGALARRPVVDQGDAMAVALQMQGAATRR